ncbi:MAG TPA: EscU/YscU/HrcU family type III secretion system export apparatus switch protein [Clostridiales bacterium]|nr:EscU/YscU/HrcU family type III secretion system export apparatus switch protein [Clostridiales bacterium]HPV02094.1 EscU/YscU/HrcU family type III secretion system export apparatus switch protein [Clostridiales bacterium]
MKEERKRKIKEAAALRYTPEKDAPEIIALGKGAAAEKIVEKAKESGVPVHEDAELAHALNMLSIGDEIPPELYEVVAKILVFVGDIDGKYPKPPAYEARKSIGEKR